MPTLTFKVTSAEARAIRARARAKNGSVSTYLRQCALPQPTRKPRLKLQRHPLSGSLYNAADTGPAVTEEQIKAALAEFP
jgi:hypothetical protein